MGGITACAATLVASCAMVHAAPVAEAAAAKTCAGQVEVHTDEARLLAAGVVSDARGGPRAPSCSSARLVVRTWLRLDAMYLGGGPGRGNADCVHAAYTGGECGIRVHSLGGWFCGYYGHANARGRCTHAGGSVIRWRQAA